MGPSATAGGIVVKSPRACHTSEKRPFEMPNLSQKQGFLLAYGMYMPPFTLIVSPVM